MLRSPEPAATDGSRTSGRAKTTQSISYFNASKIMTGKRSYALWEEEGRAKGILQDQNKDLCEHEYRKQVHPRWIESTA